MAYTDAERREFFRINYNSSIQFKSAKADGALDAVARNISQNGILFQTADQPPQLSSIVWMNLDIRTLKICREIESKALIFNNGVLGKVVRVEEDAQKDNAYDIGVCFLRKEQKESPEVQQILSQLNKS